MAQNLKRIKIDNKLSESAKEILIQAEITAINTATGTITAYSDYIDTEMCNLYVTITYTT